MAIDVLLCYAVAEKKLGWVSLSALRMMVGKGDLTGSAVEGEVGLIWTLGVVFCSSSRDSDFCSCSLFTVIIKRHRMVRDEFIPEHIPHLLSQALEQCDTFRQYALSCLNLPILSSSNLA